MGVLAHIHWKLLKLNMEGYTYTRIWQIDDRLVVAKTPEDAISIMRKYKKNDTFYQPNNIIAIGTESGGVFGYDALIEKKD